MLLQSPLILNKGWITNETVKALLLIALGFALPTTPALATGDAAAGEKVFKNAKPAMLLMLKNIKLARHLVNNMSWAAGSADGYKKYSNAMKSSGIVWNEETLDGYPEQPKAYVKGTRMVFAGLRKQKDRANVIVYLKSYSK